MNHIRGVGIDVTRISRFTSIIQKFEKNFIYKVLHLKEISDYKNIESIDQKSKYLASR
jgi:phosphopantetheinyl transferase (holo-ACP synthase)